MSSQGPVGATGYTYAPTRDSSDWTIQLKRQRAYSSYNDGAKDTGPSWMKFGNDFRLVFNQGKFSCLGPAGCTANVFSGVVPLAPVSGSGGDFVSFLNYTLYDSKLLDPRPEVVFEDPATWGTQDNTLLVPLLASNVDDDNAGDCRLENPNTIIPRKLTGTYNWDFINLHITGFYTAPVSGSYVFDIDSDDGIVMILNNVTIVDDPGYGGGSNTSDPIVLVGGTKYPLEILWSNAEGGINLCITGILVDSVDVKDTYPFSASCSPT
jgi:hypothetical protein